MLTRFSKFISGIAPNRNIVPIVAVNLLAIYVYFVYFFRPENAIVFPGFEKRLLTVLYIFGIASFILYISEIFAIIARLVNAINLPFLSKLMPSGLNNAIGKSAGYLQENFYVGGKYFFSLVGFFIFLILSPLVIFNMKELAEPAALFFIGFVVFSCIKKLDGRIMVVSALLFLLSCPFFLILKENARAELAVVYAYYSLCAAVLLQFIDYVKNRDKHDAAEKAEEQKGKWAYG